MISTGHYGLSAKNGYEGDNQPKSFDSSAGVNGRGKWDRVQYIQGPFFAGDSEMPKYPRPPRWLDIKPTKGLRLTPEQRQELLGLAVPRAAKENAMLRQVEALLGDHSFADFMFDSYKPAHARHPLQSIIKKVFALNKGLTEVDWRTAEEVRAAGSDVTEMRQSLEALQKACEKVLEDVRGAPSPRKPSLIARDNVTIRGLVQIFDQFTTLDPNSDEQEIIPQEYLDRKTEFVACALQAAHIPCPSSGDASRGEQYQGRLRQIIKRHT